MWRPAIRASGLLALLICLPLLVSGKTIVVESVLALVNEEPIYKTEFDEFRVRLQQGIYDDLVIPDEETRDKALKDSDFLLEQLVQSKVIDSEIKKMDFQVSQDQVEQEVRKIAGQNNITVAQLNNELRRQGFDLTEYRAMIENNIKRRILIEREVTSKVSISEAEIADYVQKNFREQFSAAIFEYEISHILVRTASRTEKEAEARAHVALQRYVEGTPFEEVAADFSEDPNFSPGGFLGKFQASDLSPAFQKALSDLNTGDVSQPVKSDQGYHLLRVRSKTLIPDPRLEAIKRRAQEELYALNFQNQFEFWMRQRRNEASVRINPR